MFIDKIPAKTKDGYFSVIIEISMNSNPVKYEFDKEVGAIVVDRFMQAPMFYPCNYGFIPHTLSDDGDPIDVLVMSNHSIVPGAVVKVRPVAVLLMEDESGMDEKILAVPADKVDIDFKDIKDISDVSNTMQRKIEHFFTHYKKLDKDKWVKIKGWDNAQKALSLIDKAIERNTSCQHAVEDKL